ncbi:hypothetical protein EVC12_083 [Rhizobium phage RHph_I42]|nr:hypothetical protein EVC12_083 [Rhizobium phage RHph_I42]
MEVDIGGILTIKGGGSISAAPNDGFVSGDGNTLTGTVSVTQSHPTIVAAAIQYYGITLSLPAPARHHHVSHLLFEHVLERLKEEEQTDMTGHYFEGFLTSEGRFINRKEARALLKVNGQPLREGVRIHPTEAFSEELW